MIENEKVYNLLEQFYGEFCQFRESTEAHIGNLENKITGVETSLANRIAGVETSLGNRITSVETSLGNRIANLEANLETMQNTVMKIQVEIEHEINPKIQLLFDGHLMHTEQLTRIEREVTRQNEVILRKVK